MQLIVKVPGPFIQFARVGIRRRTKSKFVSSGCILIFPSLLLFVFLIALGVGGCVSRLSTSLRPTGTYSGWTADGESVRLHFVKSAQGVIGHGSIGGRPAALSLLAVFRGTGVLLNSGNSQPVEAQVSLGDSLTLKLQGKEWQLAPQSGMGTLSAEAFTGRFHSGSQGFADELELEQRGDMVVGTGSIRGERIALSGMIETADSFRGKAVFLDMSDSDLRGKLSVSAGTLTIFGFGAPVVYQK